MKTTTVQKLRDQVRADVHDALKLPADVPVEIQAPPAHVAADISIPCFRFAKPVKRDSKSLATALASFLAAKDYVGTAEAAGPFVNVTLDSAFFAKLVIEQVMSEGPAYGQASKTSERVMVEYSSPNTNKPLHLGHVRNNTLGWSLIQLLRAAGFDVVAAILVNDRGIHICKSMVAYQKFGDGKTPQSENQKGDHFVGNYYVMFEKHFHAEYISWAKQQGFDPKQPPEGKEKEKFFNLPDSEFGTAARTMLRQWEAGVPAVRELWQQMNEWVLSGFRETYLAYGVGFDKWYYESKTSGLGRDIVAKGIERGIFTHDTDGSVQVDLKDLGKKALLRADGTALYTTQDIGTAVLKQEEFSLARSIYVVAEEQNHHFQCLFKIMEMLGYPWAKGLYHFSYGMVSLPEGRMKSREGKVVDADDLLKDIEQMVLEKIGQREESLPEAEAKQIAHQVAIGAINFYILLVTPRIGMTFDPAKSLNLQGDTGPYIQYTVTRIGSILAKITTEDSNPVLDYGKLDSGEEKALLRTIADFPHTVITAATHYDTALIPRYVLGLSKLVNTFYHKHSVVRSEPALQAARVGLLKATLITMTNALKLLSIPVPDKM